MIPQIDEVLPDGIEANRQALRSRGGVVAVATALVFAGVGGVLILVPGVLTGILGFMFLVIAFPTLPILGVPALGGNPRYILGFITSLGMWWLIGQYCSIRARRNIIAGWKEWRREFRPLAIAIGIGAIGAVGVAAIVIGVL